MKTRNLNLLYLHSIFFDLCDSMVFLALPIFVYQVYESISAVFLFQLIWGMLDFMIFIPVFNLGMHLKNPKYFMALGIVFYVFALFFLGRSDGTSNAPIILATVFYTLYASFYWLIRHWFFSLNADHKKVGRQVTIANAITLLMGFIGPILAGILSQLSSFNATFFFAAFFAFLGIVPILFFHAPPHPTQYGVKKVFKIIQKPELKSIRMTHFWEGAEYLFAGIPWLLAFTIFIGDILDLGLMVGITTLLIFLVSWRVGKWFDGRKRRQALVRTTWLHAMATLLLSATCFIPHLVYASFANFLNNLSYTASSTVSESYLYGLSNRIHPIHFHLNREIYLALGRMISAGILAVSFYFLPDTYLWLAIALGGIFSLGRLGIKKVDHLLH